MTFSLTDADGNLLTPASLSLFVNDNNNLQVYSQINIAFNQGDTEVTVNIPANANTLTNPNVSESRLARLAVELSGGSIINLKKIYIVEPVTPLTVMVNSYQTLQEAYLTAYSMPGMESWLSLPEQQQVATLKSAFNTLGRIAYKLPRYTIALTNIDVLLGTFADEYYVIRQINLITETNLHALSRDFVSKLKQAQLVEASLSSGFDDAYNKRESGIMSETVGESSMMWRPGKPLSLSISKQSAKILAGYIYHATKVGRA